MKTTILCFSFCFLFYPNSFSQKVTYKDLIGTWKEVDIDSINLPEGTYNIIKVLNDSILYERNDTAFHKYRLDSSYDITLLTLTDGTTKTGDTIYDYWMLKPVTKNKFLMEIYMGIDNPPKWKDETMYNPIEVFTRKEEIK